MYPREILRSSLLAFAEMLCEQRNRQHEQYLPLPSQPLLPRRKDRLFVSRAAARVRSG